MSRRILEKQKLREKKQAEDIRSGKVRRVYYEERNVL